jgi:hypothetical protein
MCGEKRILNEYYEQNTVIAREVVFFFFQPIVDDSELFIGNV